MTPTFRIRPATAADVDALLHLENVTFTTDRLSRAQLRRHVDSRSVVLLVADDEAGLVGTALVFFRKNSDTARLYSIATADRARGRGVGAALLVAVETAARQRGARHMKLEVRQDNAAAIRLYATRGYVQTGALPGFYEDGADACRYVKQLDAAVT